ncbi:hypothetical protein HNQ80_004141 [Anaerosolibacter carboniphilus]|uniref:Fibronectin type-III domain-containing protein n=1 Tax=Anaerosolibacter carboniphilus TaxID=1417629 RepID=A0A841KWJ4_9FIRM|nr:hypothetical protein [Anaerosolibacter carboniphilus]MBB6218004.1 hypothetical protein [Anaerosolibacter carboniphilus]
MGEAVYGDGESYTDKGLDNGNTYYYVVSTIIDGVEGPDSNEASATPRGTIVTPQPTGDKAILTITMVNGVEKEYDLPMSKVLESISWYESEGADKPYFLFDKDFNIGPFKARKDYIAFDKIASFEVNEYDAE